MATYNTTDLKDKYINTDQSKSNIVSDVALLTLTANDTFKWFCVFKQGIFADPPLPKQFSGKWQRTWGLPIR